jgi:hypothetical protein
LMIIREYGDRVFLQSEKILMERQAIELLGSREQAVGEERDFSREVMGSSLSLSELIKERPAFHSHSAHMLASFAHVSFEISETMSQEGRDEKPTRVTLGSVVAFPDTSSTLPLYVTPSSEAKIGALDLEITLPRGVFPVGVERAPLLDSVDVEISSRVSKGSLESEETVLEVSLASDGEGEALPRGLLLYLIIRIPQETQPGHLTLRTRASARTLPEPVQPVEPLVSYDGRITILDRDAIPAMVCFFYMH